jgi:RsiW-degrading membrane proteinase PrsW (M82 family)
MSYYIVISLLEEGVKYASNINTLPREQNRSFPAMLASGAVVALGFAFFENILYAYSYLQAYGVESEVLRVAFFRSLFTLALHVLCTMLLSAGFYMLLVLRGKYNKAYLLFGVLSSLAIISHMFFDVALTF